MKKQHEVFLKHMLMAVEQIEKYILKYDIERFEKDQKTIDAVIRQLEIVGEAAARVSSDIVGDSPIPWKSIVGMRNKLIHDYFGVDVGIVWQTASEAIIPLKKYLIKKVGER